MATAPLPPDYWPQAYIEHREAFAEIDPECYPIDYIDAKVFSGEWRVFGDERAAIIASLKEYPSGVREVHGIAAAGDLLAIKELIPFAEQWGREAGCRRAVIESREGWARMLPDYEVHQVALRKEL